MPFDLPRFDLPSISAKEYISGQVSQAAEKLAPVVEGTIYVAQKAVPVVKGAYSAAKTAGGVILDVIDFTKPIRNLAKKAFLWTYVGLYARQQVVGGYDPFTVMDDYLMTTRMAPALAAMSQSTVAVALNRFANHILPSLEAAAYNYFTGLT